MLAVVTVDTGQDIVDFNDGVTSLREAIFATNLVGGADEIVFDFGHDGPATILLTEGELEVTDDLTITGSGAELLTIDASGNDPTPEEQNGDGSRVFNINDGDETNHVNVAIAGVTLTGGDIRGSSLGGGAILSFESLSLSDSAITGNYAHAGGGISIIGLGDSNSTINNSTISDNSTQSDETSTRGGGIFFDLNDSSSLVISSSLISGNSSSDGGGINGGARDSSNATLDSLSILDNSAESGGGARFFAANTANLVLSSSLISGNTTAGRYEFEPSFGGGVLAQTSENSTLTISENTITENTSYFGGGASLESSNGSTLTFDSNLVSGNSADAGFGGSAGGLAASARNDSSLTVASNMITDNVGSGVYAYGASSITGNVITGNTSLSGAGINGYTGGENPLTIEANTISDNHATDGGGIGILGNGTAIVRENTITNNSATGGGGGVFVSSRNGGTNSILSSTISGNTADRGGGIFVRAGDQGVVSIDSSTISHNSAGSEGGAAYISSFDDGAVTFSSSTLSGNTADQDGGGIYVRQYASIPLTLKHSTLTDNTADANSDDTGIGGGLFVQGNAIEINHSVLAGNRDKNGTANDISGSVNSHFSLIGDNNGSGLTEAPVGLPDADGNLIGGLTLGIIDPLLSPLADNGGPTFTHALLLGSPAINAGDLNAVAGDNAIPLFDQRGENFDRILSRIDLGAYEVQELGDLKLLVDTLDDESDGDYRRGDLSLREAIELSNANLAFDTLLFDPVLANGTISLSMGELSILGDATINGLGAELLTIDASGSDPTPEENNGDGIRIFHINDGDDTQQREVTIHGLTLTGGDILGSQTSGGGAVLSTEALTLTSSEIRDNSARFGGGILVIGRGNSSINIRETDFVNNAAFFSSTSRGGGISFQLEDTSTLELRSSTLTENEGREGGAIHGLLLNESQANLHSNSLLNNSAECGGGIRVRGEDMSRITISSSIITGNQASGDDFLHFGGGIDSGVGDQAQLVIEGNTIEDNLAYLAGGGMSASASTEAVLTIRDNSIQRNDSQLGGGIYSAFGLDSQVAITGNTIADNTASQEGGGISVSGPVDIVGNTISGNTSNLGGGIFSYVRGGSSEFVIQENTISKNHSFTFGGGIGISHGVADDGTNVSLLGNTIVENTTDQNGAGLAADLSDGDVLTIVKSTFSENSAERGGAISIQGSDASKVVIESSTISGNRAVEAGGLLLRMVHGAEAQIVSSTISGNSADQSGGGLVSELFAEGSLRLAHTTVTNNVADADFDGDGLGGGILLANGSVELDHTIVAGNQDNSGVVNEIAGIFNSRFSLVGFGAEFLGPLAQNGGPTATHALLPGSPAIDTGEASPSDIPEFDQRGETFLRIAGQGIDIGAYEAQTVPSADFDSDGDVDGADFLAWQRGYDKPNAQRADGNSDDDTDTDASDLMAWQVSFGQPQAQRLVMGSNEQLAAVSNQPAEPAGASRTTLIDAAIVLATLEREPEEYAELVDRPTAFQTIFTASEPNNYVLAPHATNEPLAANPAATATPDYDQTWLEEELLDRVFG